MNRKMKMRMLSILLCFVMLVGLLPTTVFAAEKNKISEVEATATLPDKLYVGMNLYDPNLLETISFNTTKGAPAKLDADSPWMYYNEETGYYERIYKNDDARIVKAGVRYAYAAQLRIDGVDYETNTVANTEAYKLSRAYTYLSIKATIDVKPLMLTLPLMASTVKDQLDGSNWYQITYEGTLGY